MSESDWQFLVAMIGLGWIGCVMALLCEWVTYLYARREARREGRLNKRDWTWIRL